MVLSESDNFNAAEIAEEREHLRKTLLLIKEQIELLENDGFVYRTVDFYDDSAVEELREEKFRHDERLRDARILRRSLATPYFARMLIRQTGSVIADDTPSMTRTRTLIFNDEPLEGEADIYVGANVIVYKDKIIIYSHNSPLGNKVYDRFEKGKISYGGYEYEVIFRRKFDIREGELVAMFQDYSAESGGIVYDKFLAHMLEKKRGDKRLTDIIPTIQANQNAIITRPADENCLVTGCAGCGKTMILLQRLEYLAFNKKLELGNAALIAPSERYKEHIRPVIDDLMLGQVRRLTMAELYRELILSLHGIRSSDRRAIADATLLDDSELPQDIAAELYGDGIKRKLITALAPVKKSYLAALSKYRAALERYENEYVWSPDAVKPRPPAVSVSTDKLGFLPKFVGYTKARLYILLTAYCYILGKPSFSDALFIDEGQDYYVNEYKLLAELTRATVNIYGDENQQLAKERGVGDFAALGKLWKLERYALNENYRNAREITAFVNGELGMDVTSLGLEGGTVERIRLEELKREDLCPTDGDRIAVLYSADDRATEAALKKIVPPSDLYTVAQAKGMEYERVYACGKLSDREKYVAYTRALAKLVIAE